MSYPTPEEAATFAKGLKEAHERMTGGMPDGKTKAASRAVITDSVSFSSAGSSAAMPVFSVNAGISISDALNEIFDLNSLAKSVLLNATADPSDSDFAAAHLLHESIQIVHSILKSLPK